MGDSILPIGKRIHERSPHADTCSSEAQGFDNVSPTSDSAVDIDLAFAALQDLWIELVDLQKGMKSGRRASRTKPLSLRDIPDTLARSITDPSKARPPWLLK